MEKYGETMIHWIGLCWFNVFLLNGKPLYLTVKTMLYG